MPNRAKCNLFQSLVGFKINWNQDDIAKVLGVSSFNP